MKKNLQVYAALLPCFALIGIFLLYPAVDAVVKSFYAWKVTDYNNPKYIGLANFAEIFADPVFWQSIRVLLLMSLWSFVLLLCIIMPITYLVYGLGDTRRGAFVQRAFVIPMTIPSMVFILFWKFVYEPNNGLLNSILRMLNLDALTHVWLGEAETALPALMLQNFPWLSACGFQFLILLAGFQAVDKALHESALLDGASGRTIFFKIDIPLIIPQLRVLIMLNIINCFQQYTQQLIMTQGGPNYATTVPGLLLYYNAFRYGDLGLSSTIGVVLFVVIMTLTLFTNKFFKAKA